MGALFAGMVLLPCRTPDPAQGATPTKDLYPSPVSKPRVGESKAGLKILVGLHHGILDGQWHRINHDRWPRKTHRKKFDGPRQDLNASGFLTPAIGAAWGRKDHKP